MIFFSRAAAERALGDYPLMRCNRRVVDCWLSLWEGDEFPRRADFDPQMVPAEIPGLMVQEIKKGAYVRVRQSGKSVNQAFGLDMTGRDILELSPPDERAPRRERNDPVADGAASYCVRSANMPDGTVAVSQEVQLPFRDITPDGARLVLFHTSWRAVPSESALADLQNLLRSPIAFRVIPLTSPKIAVNRA